MVAWSIQTFAGMEEVAQIVVVTEADLVDEMRSLLARLAPYRQCSVVRGGAIRQESVYAGLCATVPECDGALTHDGARPLITAADVRSGMRQVRRGRGALVATPVVDTIKDVAFETRTVRGTLDRARLWAAQTPQLAHRDDLIRAHEKARRDAVAATDDSALLERIGIEMIAVPATSPNFKVTLPDDVARAESILRQRTQRQPEPVEG